MSVGAQQLVAAAGPDGPPLNSNVKPLDREPSDMYSTPEHVWGLLNGDSHDLHHSPGDIRSPLR